VVITNQTTYSKQKIDDFTNKIPKPLRRAFLAEKSGLSLMKLESQNKFNRHYCETATRLRWENKKNTEYEICSLSEILDGLVIFTE